MFRLTPESPDDFWEVEYLLDVAFGQGRASLSSYRLREGAEPVEELCFVARDNAGVVSGTIRYWPIAIGSEQFRSLLLGPIAVHPIMQGEGLGSLLIRHSLRVAVTTGWVRVVLIGDESYYGRFGFRNTDRLEFPAPTDPARILAMPLVAGAFEGVSGTVQTLTQAGSQAQTH